MDDTLPTNPGRRAYNPAAGDALPVEAAGRYSEEGLEIGRGGIGRVIVRTDALLGREVAFKELHPEFQPARGSEAVDVAERFLSEARVTARLEHPGVVPVYELGRRLDGTLYYAMKRVKGRTLEQALEDCSGLADRLTLMQHVLDVVQTLAFAHSKGVIHRDLKPANIMVGEFGETQVLDWGLARVRGMNDVAPTGEALAPAGKSTSSTQAGQLLGTPAYMSPEQAAGENAAVDERSDVWCLGAMLFETLTGQSLFEAEDVKSMLEAVKVAPVRKVRQLEPQAPRALAEVADKALQRDPERRFTSAVEMAEALEFAMRKPTVGGRPVGAFIAFAGVVVALLLALAGLVTAQRDAEAARSFAEDSHAASARNESALLARLSRDALEQRDFAKAEALARQALASSRADEGDALARGVVALLDGAARPTVRWEVSTPGCAQVAAERALVACPTFGGVELRGLETGELLHTLSTGPGGWQHAAAFMPDGTLVSAGDDRLVHVWDAEHGTELAKWSGHQAPVLALALRGGTVATGAQDGEVRLWESSTGTSKLVAKHSGPVRALAFTRHDELATSGPDGFKLWPLEGAAAKKGEPRLTLDVPAQVIARGPKGLLLGVEREVFALERDDADPLAAPGLDEVTAVASSPVAALLVGDGRGRVRAFDERRALVWQLTGIERGVRGLAVDPGDSQGRVLVVASRGRALSAFDLPEDPRLFLEQPAVAWGWDEGATSARAALLLGDRRGRVVNAAGATLLDGPGARIRAISGAKGVVLAGGDDGVVRRLGEGGRELQRHEGRAVTSLAIAADGARAAFGWDDGTLTLWQLALNREIVSSRGSPARVLAFSPDGKWLAVGRDDRFVALLEAETGKEVQRLELKAGPSALAFGTQTLAVGLERGGVLLELPSLRELGSFSAGNEPVRSLSFAAAGDRLAGGSDDGQAYVWSVGSRRLTHVLPVETGDVTLVRFVDDEHLVLAGADRTVRAVTLAK
ncbi:MAG: protein kinase [Archangiaceae bacterium]|nr:protein kinase [Archangiaceae bacterium]